MDFTTALGRLLRDGALRDEFALHPRKVTERLGLPASERAVLMALPAADLEFQAAILLGKRFDAVQGLIPRTLTALGEGRRIFFNYARTQWPEDSMREMQDAVNFCRYCARLGFAEKICEVEVNRMNFLLNEKALTLHLARNVVSHDKSRIGIQILIRMPARGWRELFFYFGL